MKRERVIERWLAGFALIAGLIVVVVLLGTAAADGPPMSERAHLSYSPIHNLLPTNTVYVFGHLSVVGNKIKKNNFVVDPLCNEQDGCYPYGDGCEERDYYCVGDEEGCNYTSSNRHTDSWVDTGNTRWVDENECEEKEQKEQEYRDYKCSEGSCDYSINTTKWVDTGIYNSTCIGVSLAPPEITSFTPLSYVDDTVGNWSAFNVAVSQAANVSWYLNDMLVLTNGSVLEAKCTLLADVVGEHNVTAIASNANGSDMQLWIWDVTELELPKECEGTDTCCGIYPNCGNCNDQDGCYQYGDGCEERDYYCAGNGTGCNYTSSNRHIDGWMDIGNTRWVDENKCEEKEQMEQEYRDYECSAGSCNYSINGTKWIDTGNTSIKANGTICGCTANNTVKRCYDGNCTDTGIGSSSNCCADVACDGKKPGEPCGDGRICSSTCNCVSRAPPEITSFAPLSYVDDTVYNWRTFNVTINQAANVSWYLNNTLVLTNESVLEAKCTLLADVVGEHNVTAIASNANGSDMQTWIWDVTELTKECEGTDTCCGSYPNCGNCTEKDGCYPYGDGCEERDYYCAGNGTGCNYTSSNRHNDSWVDTGNTRWVDVNECQDKEQKEQEYRDYECSAGSCNYRINDTKWIDTGNTSIKANGTICGCTANNTVKRCYDGNCTDTGIGSSSNCCADVACDGKKPGEPCGDGRICNSTCNCVSRAPPEISSFTPLSYVDDTVGNWSAFNVTVNQAVNVSWYLNGTLVLTNESVREAKCTLLADVVGVHNVTAIASNANGSDMQMWIWDVTELELPKECEGTDTCCGIYPNCGNCNDQDGCYQYGDGCEERDYYCAGNGTGCNYTSSNRHNDSWMDTGNTRWVDVSECEEKEQKEQEYRDYKCSEGSCNYRINDTKWVDTGIYNSTCNGVSLAPLEITSFAPLSYVDDTVGKWRTFNVTVNQVVNVSWYLNGTLVLTNESVLEAKCTLLADVVGEHNVTAIASNANGSDMQLWIWDVTELELPKECEGTDTCYGIYPNCGNCNEQDGCYPYGDGCEGRDYYCAGNGAGCNYTSSNRHNDSWEDTGNTRWVDVNKCQEKEQKEQEYRDYKCSEGSCYYSINDTKWVDTGNTSIKANGTICGCTANNTVKRCYDGSCTDTGIGNTSNCCADVAGDGKKANCTCGDICVITSGWWRNGGAFHPTDTPIQAAIDNAISGETICVKDGTYTENVDVDTQLTIRSENGAASTTVNALYSNDHVFEVTADYVSISGFTVNGATGSGKAGIWLDNNIDHCNIYDNNASGNNYGIYLRESSYNMISRNTVSNNDAYGIRLSHSSNNTISGNTALNNYCGIYLSYSSSNTIHSNTASNNDRGIRLFQSSNNRIYNNYFNNKNNAQDDGTNLWNITPTLGENIIGGSWLGGNYWSDYAGIDTNGDGLGDTLLPYNANGGILVGGDMHPLVPAGIAPLLSVEKTDDPDPVQVGGTLNYSISVSNKGYVNASAVIVTEIYDVNVTFDSAIPVPSSGNDMWIFPALNANETKRINISVSVNPLTAIGSVLHNTVNVSCAEGVSDTDTEATTVFSGEHNCTCGDICVITTGWWRNGGAFHPTDTPIQAAIDNATAGETICVKDGTYTENVDVDTQLTIRSENGAASTTVNALYSNDHVFEVTADYVSISGFTVNGATGSGKAGIWLDNNIDHCNIYDNNASGNNYGIYLRESSYNMISRNTVSNNDAYGIRLSHSSNNTISGNTALNNYCGIYLSYSSSNTIHSNTASNNDRGIRLFQSSNNRIYNNYFNNKNNAQDDGTNLWNLTPTLGENIIGGSWLGGNYWSDYAGIDTNGDGLGDTLLPYNANGGILVGGDMHPLVPAGIAPLLSVEKTDDPDPVQVGGTLNYSISVSNKGYVNASAVIVTEFYDVNVTFDSAIPVPSSGNDMWIFPALNANETKRINISVTVNPLTAIGSVLHNTVNVSCAEGVSDTDTEATTVFSGEHNCTCGDICVITTGWWRNGGAFHPTDTPIQAAIDNATAGETICVKDGTYTENVDVDTQLTIRSENGAASTTVNALYSNDHVFEVTADYVSISGFTVNGATGSGKAGIWLDNNIDHCNIYDNNASGNNYGIYLRESSYNMISRNTVSNNDAYGIRLSHSSNNTISGNTALNNYCGIYLSYSSSNTIHSNTASNNDRGIRLFQSSNNRIYNNYFNNKNNAQDDGTNLWNLTPTLGENIIGGSWLGGNYWSDYAGIDANGDGLGDTLLPYNSNGGILVGGDMHPLVPAGIAPLLSVEKTDDPDPVQAGGTLNYSISVSNKGYIYASAVIVTEIYDVNVTFDSAIPVPSSGNDMWIFPALNANETKRINISVTVNPLTAMGSVLHNTVTVSCAEGVTDTDTEATTVFSGEPNCTCGDICVIPTGWWRNGGAFHPSDSPIQDAIDNASTGETIFVYSGAYYENIIVDKSITLQGDGADVTTIYGGGTGDAISNCNDSFDCIGISGFVIDGFTIKSYNAHAIRFYSKTTTVSGIIKNNIIKDSAYGINAGSNCNLEITNNLIYNNRNSANTDGSGIGIMWNTPYGVSSTIYGNTIVDNYHGIWVYNANAVIINNIVVNNSGGQNIESTGINHHGGGTIDISYNDVYGNDVNYRGDASPGLGDISTDPLFVDPSTGDYHLQSTQGSYHGGAWTPDANTSPCIDVGDPTSPYDNEPEPNGNRINMGAYGNTNQASKSPTATLLNITQAQTDKSTYALNENVMVSCIVQNEAGYNITADSVDAEILKPDSSIEWVTMTEGLVGHYNGAFTNTSLNGTYNVTIYANKMGYVNDTAELSFDVSTLPVHNLDTGENFSTIQAAIDDSDTLDGHTIAVDPGIYNENVVVDKSLILKGEDRNITIIDGGGSGDVVYVTADNCVIDSFTVRNSDNCGIKLYLSFNTTIKNINASDNQAGIYLDHSSNSTIENNNAFNNSYGIGLEYSSRFNTITGNNASKNAFGIYMVTNDNTISGNIALNNNYGIFLSSSSNNLIYNNYFDNTNNAQDDGNNIWNITKTAGPNIIGGSWLGGNYWSDYAGIDTNGDGLGDTLLPYNSNGDILVGGDMHPLVPAGIAPLLSVEKTDDPDPVQAGGTLNYSISVSNKGYINASAVIVTEIYDVNVTFDSAIPAPSSGNDMWIFPALNANETKRINISVTVNPLTAMGTVLHNSVNVSCAEGVTDTDTEATTVFSGELNCTCGDICVITTGWWRDDGAFHLSDTPIQDAIDNAGAGDTICVKDGIYYENVVVDKSLTLLGADKDSTIIDGGGKGDVVYVTADYVNISNFTLRNSSGDSHSNLKLFSSSNSKIVNNNVCNSTSGIYLKSSCNNEIIKNNVFNIREAGRACQGIRIGSSSANNSLFDNGVYNNHMGIRVYSGNNILANNTVSNNFWGIELGGYSMNNILRNNTMSNNIPYNLLIRGYNHNIDTTNNVNGKPVYYYFNQQNKIIESLDSGHLQLDYCSNITLRNCYASNGDGIKLVLTNDSKVINNIASNNFDGIRIDSSYNNQIINNTVNSNDGEGILVRGDFNSITNNNINGDKGRTYAGIFIGNTRTDNIIQNNTITETNLAGIYVYFASNNIISDNFIYSNRQRGINLQGSDHNTIFNNNLTNNNQGIRSTSNSRNNLIFHNNIVDNSINAVDDNPANNDWHHPFLLEGNYWSDYTGLDDGSGTGKHAIAGDGIGDTDIPHPAEDYDFYPFINESGWLVPVNELNIIHAQTDKITYALSETVTISCVVQNETGYNITADSVNAVILKPDSSIEWVTMTEGLVGNYNGTFTNTSLNGTYNVTIYANKTGYVNDTAELSFEVSTFAPVLSIEKSDNPDPVSPGGTLNYTIHVNNTGNATATNVMVKEKYDANVTFVSAVPAPSQGNDTWQFPTLNVSETRWINISVTVNASVPNGTVLHNLVNVSCEEGVTDSDTEATTVFSGEPNCTCGDICVITTGWWRDGGAFHPSDTPIQEAIDNAGTGDTICVKDGTYTENVDVDKRLTIRSENGAASTTVNALYPYDHVFEVTADYVSISGFSVKRATGIMDAGIHLGGNHCNISDNIASDNYVGIEGEWSNCNTISGNTVSNNQHGIALRGSSDNMISSNTVSNGHSGIGLRESSDNAISSNTVSNNNYGISLFSSSNNNLIYDNYFNNTDNAQDDGTNIWNIAKTAGTNIIGGSWLGGNYWSDYAGIDANGDGLGDTLLPYNANGAILVGGDLHPLVPAGIAPLLSVEKTDDPDPVQAGGTLNYSIIVSNKGYMNASAVIVREIYDVNVTYDSAIPAPSLGNDMWIFPALNANETKRINISVTVNPLTAMGTVLHNTVNVSCAEGVTDTDTEATTVFSEELNCTCGDICVITTGWWRDGGAFHPTDTPIQSAIDNATAGETICVKDGTYTENVDVDTQLTIRSENGAASTTVNALYSNDHVFEVIADYVSISGFTVKGATDFMKAGICLDSNIDHSNIYDNNASGNYHGIDLSHSSNNTISDNNVSNNVYGIRLSSSSNTIHGNTASNNDGYGIRLSSRSNNNRIYNNYFNNKNNARDDGTNIWNIAKTAGTNIIGGSWLGGNYWCDYAGIDANGDGLGDTLLPYNANGEILVGGDMHPLVAAGIAPLLSVEKTDDPDPVQAGGTLNYSISVNNVGYMTTTNVIVTETYDANVTFDSAMPVPSGGNNVWIFPALNANETKWINISVSVNPSIPIGTVLHNIVNATCDQGVTDSDTEATTVFYGELNCTCGDICVITTGWWRDGGAFHLSDKPIQAAIDTAISAETICVKDGTYTENVDVNKRLTIRSENGAASTTVNALYSNDHVFEVTADYVSISGFSVEGATGGGNGITLTHGVSYCDLSNNNCSCSRCGITLHSDSSHNTLTNNIANSNDIYGIHLYSSNSNNLTNNIANSNRYNGIHLYSSNNNAITNNIANSNNNSFGYGISLFRESSNNTLEDNTANSNNNGINLDSSSNYNTLANNTADSNDDYGIYLGDSSNYNTLTSNTASNNDGSGIRLYYSSDNTIYNNYFNNTNNAQDDGTNIWDITPTLGENIIGGSWLGGNYWSDYAGEDTNGDGLGDTLLPYNASGEIITGGDWHPLVQEPSPCFIATAAYGTPLHEDINVLRKFRDEYMMPNPAGQAMVKIYYTTSPPVADVIRANEGLRTTVRDGLVKPLVEVTRRFME